MYEYFMDYCCNHTCGFCSEWQKKGMCKNIAGVACQSSCDNDCNYDSAVHYQFYYGKENYEQFKNELVTFGDFALKVKEFIKAIQEN